MARSVVASDVLLGSDRQNLVCTFFLFLKKKVNNFETPRLSFTGLGADKWAVA
jgi:hypothetical protein